tara:strand:- start:116 stop:367 length:252 start_codon:yes stop_codon:yes gene_type:complete
MPIVGKNEKLIRTPSRINFTDFFHDFHFSSAAPTSNTRMQMSLGTKFFSLKASTPPMKVIKTAQRLSGEMTDINESDWLRAWK